MEIKHTPRKHMGDVQNGSTHNVETGDIEQLERLGYAPSNMRRNRSTRTLLFQTLAIACVPFGIGGPIISAFYGGGPIALFVGWIVVVILSECVALSLAEFASKYPTSAGPYYWSFQVASKGKTTLSFITGWVWLIANWTITLSVNFGFASLLAGTITMYNPDWEATDWQLTLIFYALLLLSALVCVYANRWLALIDTISAGLIGLTIIIVLIALSVSAKSDRHSASYALGHYEDTFSGWGNLTFFIGLLPSAYVFSALGMISAMAEECADPAVKVPKAMTLAVPIQGIAGLVFILPILFTLAPLEDILAAPYGQALPALLGLINLGSSSAFTAFVSVGVMALEVSYVIPVATSLFHGRRDVNSARFTCGPIIGTTVNCIAVAWIFFQVVLFSMPTVLPVTTVTMNYASVVFVGFAAISAVWYFIHARKVYKGPPASDGISAH
uniref:Amino acid permease/ SLC12A domain-containing protein n=1 Tax=Bionectria ochroleuca TaxID=29856 RepID=A0A0B7KFZ5_BIOOC